MIGRPRFGIAVSDIEHSVDFYRNHLGLTVSEDSEIPGTAVLVTPRGQRILIAGPKAPRLSEVLADPHTILLPSEKIFITDPAFDERLESWSCDGSFDFELVERPWGDRMIEVTDPDGYGITFCDIRERSPDEIRELFRLARDGIYEAIDDLNEKELSWRPEPDSWSIREIIHHVADSNLTVLHVARAALAHPGSPYHSNPYDQNHYASELRYQQRDIQPSLQLINSMEDVLTSMVETIPDSWERSVTTSSGNIQRIERLLQMQATHTLEHLEQIRDVRRALGML